MLSCVADETDEALFNIIMKIKVEGTVNFFSAKIFDDVGHVSKVSVTPINGVFDVSMVRIALVKLMDKWQRERSVDVCVSGVVPQTNISANNFLSHDCIGGVLSRNLELKKDGRKFFQGSGQNLGHLGSAIFSVSGDIFGKSVQSSPINCLERFNLCFDGRKSSIYARFGIFSLRVEIDGLNKSNDSGGVRNFV